MKIALAQLNPIIGDFAENARKIIDGAREARSRPSAGGGDLGSGGGRRLSGRDRLHHVAVYQRPCLQRRDPDRHRQDRYLGGFPRIGDYWVRDPVEITAESTGCEVSLRPLLAIAIGIAIAIDGLSRSSRDTHAVRRMLNRMPHGLLPRKA